MTDNQTQTASTLQAAPTDATQSTPSQNHGADEKKADQPKLVSDEFFYKFQGLTPHTIFCGGMPPTTPLSEILAFLRQFGDVTWLKYPQPPEGLPRLAFASYSSELEMQNAISFGTIFALAQGRPFRMSTKKLSLISE
ncbi:MAG: hypothetical protein EZS28_004152 [Streblomastix strix]|uniref:RRM domain-containing protein n=1 Tax=Streblomastix strix TaxID=222440 RepID=A0A5J4WZG5_9EUKA|nr:MAG: hypothetical protein EZS28_004152 [Streblomastix strix]